MSEQNPIKKANKHTEFTTENLADLLRCRTDPVYFMEKFMYVQHPKLGKIPFSLYDYQQDLVRHFHGSRFSIALIGRQMGKCSVYDTSINIAMRPSGLKKLILRIFNRKLYDELFKTE